MVYVKLVIISCVQLKRYSVIGKSCVAGEKKTMKSPGSGGRRDGLFGFTGVPAEINTKFSKNVIIITTFKAVAGVIFFFYWWRRYSYIC